MWDSSRAPHTATQPPASSAQAWRLGHSSHRGVALQQDALGAAAGQDAGAMFDRIGLRARDGAHTEACRILHPRQRLALLPG